MGRKRILRQNPHDKPVKSSRSPAPRFHAATAGVRKSLELAFYEFRIWYRQAAGELEAGNLNAEFPPGYFPPGLPFCTRAQPPWGDPRVRRRRGVSSEVLLGEMCSEAPSQAEIGHSESVEDAEITRSRVNQSLRRSSQAEVREREVRLDEIFYEKGAAY